ncbi:MAG: hypothetical protein IT249_04375 [Chitinophagaceae bacterium]|nr:hypothetical protein [Chitinophagaceae bacterium]
MKAILLSAVLLVLLQTTQSQISYTWNGAVSSAWTTPGNWTPSGVPGITDDVKIVTASNLCRLAANTTVNNITLTSGTLDLNSFTLTANGTTATFSSGTIQNGNIVVPSAGTSIFGTGTVTMNCAVTISTATISIRNTTFQGTVNITKTGSTGDANNGNNIFSGISTITNAGSGTLILGATGADKFYNDATFNNSGSNSMHVAYNSSSNIFSGLTTFNNTSSGPIYVGWYSAGVAFNNDIIVNSAGGNGVQFCGGSTTASATIAAGHTIGIGSTGFSSGSLSLRQLTQAGTTPVNIALSGTAELRFGPTANFGGPVTVSSPNIYTSSTVFNSVVNFTKTDGTTSNASSGGNTFNSTLTVNYTSANGTGYWSFGNGLPDVYNGDVYSNNNSLDRIIFGHNSTNNQFNGNLIVTQTGSSRGTSLTWNNGSTAVMAAGKAISIGGAGYSAGYLYIQGLTQNGNVPINLTTTGSSSVYTGEGNTYNPTVIGGAFTVSAPDIYIRGTTFNSDAFITKTGGGSNHNNSKQNIFNGNVSIDQQSSGGYFMLGYNANDQFNGNITVSSTGTGGISLGWTSGAGNPTLAAGKTISVGAGGYGAGYLQLGGFTQTGSNPINLNLTGTSSFYVVNPGTPSTFNGALTVTAPDIYLRGGIFNSASTFTKTGGSSNHNNSVQNIFNAPLTINQQSSTGYFMLGYNSNDLFNDDITVTSTGTGGIYLGYSSGTGTPTLAAGKTLLTGAAGFSDGFLSLNTFTQLGSAPINLAFTGTTSMLRFARNSVIGGNLTVSSPNIYFDGCTFNGTVDATKTGAAPNASVGGNIFNQHCAITNSGSSYLLLGNNLPDIWNDDVIFSDNGSERLLPCWSSAGNQFNGNIYVNTSGSAGGIQFCGGNNTATATLAAGKTIQAGTTGLTAGYLILRQFTQLGNAPINLTLSSTATNLQFGPSSSLGGNVTSTSPGLFFNGCTFSGTVNATKTGNNSDASSGNNIFNNNTIITNAGAGYLLFGNGNADQFNSTATFNNTGSNNIYVAYNSSNNIFGGVTTFNNTPVGNTLISVGTYSVGSVFNDNIIVTSTSGQGVQFCTGNATASATLSAGKTISIGSAGFSSGTLLLRQFTQSGSTAQNLSLTGAAALTFGPSSLFEGNVTSSSPGLYFNGCTFSGTVNSVKTGITSDASNGNNIFNGNTTITNAGSGYVLLGNGNLDQFNANTTFNNTGSNSIYVAYNSSNNIFGGTTTFNNSPVANTAIYVSTYSAGTVFNDNIIVSSANGQGVQFCSGNTTASANLSAGKTISVGGAGFTAGTLLLRQFTQTGSTAQNISLTGSGILTFGPSSAFGGNLTSSSPSLYFNGCTFSGVVNATKTGSTGDASSGNNIFNGKAYFINNGTGQLLMTNSYGDTYNDDVSFTKGNTGLVYPNYNQSSNYAGSVTIASTTAITFGAGSGTAVFNGSGTQNISITTGTPTPVFTRLSINNSGSGVNLSNTSINVSQSLVLTSGLLKTTTSYILTMLNNSTVAAGNALSASYVNGPMRYQKSASGSTTLNFPVGNGSDCRPVSLTVNHTNGTLYTYQAQLFNASAAALGYTLPSTVTSVSTVHYYTIGRTDGSGNNQPTAGLGGNQTIQIFFGANDLVTDGSNITVVKNTYTAATSWVDVGGAGGPPYAGGINLTGSITSTSTPTAFNSFSTFAIGFRVITVLPITLPEFTAKTNNNYVDLAWTTASEINNDFFSIERSNDGVNFELLQTVNTKAVNGNSKVNLYYTAQDRNPFNGRSYYRLKQTDLNGKYVYSKIAVVSFDKRQTVSIYPNPSVGSICISGLEGNTAKAEWYDVSGRKVLVQSAAIQNGVAKFDTRLSNGIYLLKYTTEKNAPQAQQIIIRR